MKVLVAISLFALWLLLSVSYNPVHMVIGAIVAICVVLLSPKKLSNKKRFSVVSIALYFPWLFLRVMKSGLHVCKLILMPSMPVAPKIVTHETKLKGDLSLAILGNSVTLTPGTLTLEVEPGKLVVHALDESSLQDLTSGTLDQKVDALFKIKDDK